MIFHKEKIIFIHIPKTAGHSIEQFFLPGERDYRVYDENIIFGVKDGFMSQHFSVKKIKSIVSAQVFNSYFKFCFVRNPWDRMVSAYFYLKPHYDLKFGGFSKWLVNSCERVVSGNYRQCEHISPQTDFILDEDGSVCVDFIGKYENIDCDFDYVLKKNKLSQISNTLKKTNVSGLRNGIDYRSMYNEKTIDFVRRTYSKEIEMFDFVF